MSKKPVGATKEQYIRWITSVGETFTKSKKPALLYNPYTAVQMQILDSLWGPGKPFKTRSEAQRFILMFYLKSCGETV